MTDPSVDLQQRIYEVIFDQTPFNPYRATDAATAAQAIIADLGIREFYTFPPDFIIDLPDDVVHVTEPLTLYTIEPPHSGRDEDTDG